MRERGRVRRKPERSRPSPSSPHTGAPRRITPTDPTRGPSIDLDADERLERLTLIEFFWDISSGIQPVILASRRLLH